jgi:uncharacterized membrane protein YcaP (DUF421 family)
VSGLKIAELRFMFFSSWADVGRVIVVSTIIFIVIIAVMRLVGPQALAKMSPFDMVFTVMLGSVVATVAVTKGITIAEAVTAILTLLILQEIVRWAQSRFIKVHHAVRQAPSVFVWNGQLLEDRLEADNLSADEVRAAVRKAGHASLSTVRIVVLENDGEWSVVPMDHPDGDESAFLGLPIPGRPDNSPKSEGDKARTASNYRIP